MYHSGSRELQDAFGSAALADRLAEKLDHNRFTESDKAFIESSKFFFIATASAEGAPDCSFKAGPAGFVRIVSPDILVFPDYDGNGMFRSLGNIRINPNVGMLFIAFDAMPKRLRVNGKASVSLDDPLLATFVGAQALVRVTPEHIFPNCPRYIPDLSAGRESAYIPASDTPPLEPAWKSFSDFNDVVPPRRPVRK